LSALSNSETEATVRPNHCNGHSMKRRKMFVALLREFARRTAQEHRENLQSAHSQLRLINSIAREILGATRESDAHVDALTVASI
jgi:hypothetical protein